VGDYPPTLKPFVNPPPPTPPHPSKPVQRDTSHPATKHDQPLRKSVQVENAPSATILLYPLHYCTLTVMQSFTWALSPMASVLSTTTGNDFETTLLAQHVALSSTETITSLIDMIPADYHFVLKPALLGYAATATKLIAGCSAITKLKAHQAARTFPTFIHKTPPAIQLTKEFTQNQAGAAGLSGLADATLAYCCTTLSKSIMLKEEEVAHLNGHFDANIVSNALSAIIDTRYESLRATLRIPTYVTAKTGDVTFEGDWQDNPATKLLYQQVKVDAVTYAYHIFNIVEARESLVMAKALDKKHLAKQADIEMANSARAGPSIQSLVDKAVNAHIKMLRSFGSKVSRSSTSGKT
jgi:hypothetical protein